MLIRIVLIVGMVFLSCSLHAEESTIFSCKTKGLVPKSKALVELKSTQEQYTTLSSFSASFTQTSYLAALESSETSTGQMWFEKPGKMRWVYDEPDEQVFVLRDNTMWLYQKVENQVIIDDVSKVALAELPVSFLLGLGDLEKDFTLIKACKTEDGLVFDLAPLKKKENDGSEKLTLKDFKLLVDSEYTPLGGRIVDSSGNVTQILFGQIKKNISIPKESFVANFPKEVDLDDRRSNRSREVKL